MTANSENLKRAIRGSHAYLNASPRVGIDYIRQVIRPALRDAMKEVKGTLLSQHNVDPKDTNDVVHYTSLQALFAMLLGRAEPSGLSEGAMKNGLPVLALFAVGDVYASLCKRGAYAPFSAQRRS